MISLAAICILIKSPALSVARREVFVFEHTAKAPVVQINLRNGSVTVRPGLPDRVVVKEWVGADRVVKLGDVFSSVKKQGNVVRVAVVDDQKTPGDPDQKYPGAVNYTPPESRYTIYAPRDCQLDIVDTNGRVDIQGIRGSVHAKAPNGGIRFEAQQEQIGKIFATTYNGKIFSPQVDVAAKKPAVTLDSYNATIEVSAPPEVTEFKAVFSFDGEKFVKKDLYLVNGAFTMHRPEGSIREVDGEAKYLVPAFADAHCHHIDYKGPASFMNDAYLKTGTLYVQSMGNHLSGRSGAEEIVNRPGAIDATFANAGFTS